MGMQRDFHHVAVLVFSLSAKDFSAGVSLQSITPRTCTCSLRLDFATTEYSLGG
jgi:hypothetical protein